MGSIVQPTNGRSAAPGGNIRSATSRSSSCSTGLPLTTPTLRPRASATQPSAGPASTTSAVFGRKKTYCTRVSPARFRIASSGPFAGGQRRRDCFLQAVQRNLAQLRRRGDVFAQLGAGGGRSRRMQTPAGVAGRLQREHAVRVDRDAERGGVEPWCCSVRARPSAGRAATGSDRSDSNCGGDAA